MAYKDGDKLKLKNGCIVTISGRASSVDMSECYTTYEKILVTPNMIQEELN